jgi:Mg-chelatase subunit ChlD
MRGCVAVMLLLGAPLAPCAENQRLHATFYTANAAQGDIEAALELPAPQFNTTRLVEDGHRGNAPVAWKEFRATAYGVTAVLAIDTSGSVQGTPFESVKSALRDYVSSSRAQDRIAIVTFSDSVDVRQSFTADKVQLARAIDALQVGGTQTLLNSAIAKSITLLTAEPLNPRKHLLVITDGKNEGPGPSPGELADQARLSGIPVDCIGVTRLAVRYLQPMQALALASGGVYLRARGYPQLRQAMGQGIAGLLSSPVATFHLAHVVPDGQKHQLQIVADGASSNVAAVLLPAPPKSDILLYISIAAAAVLFGIGMMLIRHSRKGGPVSREGVIAPAVPCVPASPPRQARVATTYERNEAAIRIQSGAGAAAVAPARQEVVPPFAEPPLESSRSGTAPLAPPTEFRQVFAAPAPGRPVAWFRLVSQSGATTPIPPLRFPIDALEVWVGTGQANQIRVRHDTAVSRAHACIQWSGGDLYLLDNRPTNGTFVNGRAMQPGSRVRLKTGDRIVIGESIFSLDPAEPIFSLDPGEPQV